MIMIVDDQREIGRGLQRLLRHAGHESVAVTSGPEALAMLRINKPSLLLLDINMPDMDGLAVLRTIKGSDDLRDVRTAMYSSDTQPAHLAEAQRLGAVDFLVKGTVGFDQLVARIAELSA